MAVLGAALLNGQFSNVLFGVNQDATDLLISWKAGRVDDERCQVGVGIGDCST